jgi:hypothetical protein
LAPVQNRSRGTRIPYWASGDCATMATQTKQLKTPVTPKKVRFNPVAKTESDRVWIGKPTRTPEAKRMSRRDKPSSSSTPKDSSRKVASGPGCISGLAASLDAKRERARATPRTKTKTPGLSERSRRQSGVQQTPTKSKITVTPAKRERLPTPPDGTQRVCKVETFHCDASGQRHIKRRKITTATLKYK